MAQENKTPIEMLIETIDYSFLKTDGTYDESLTYPVIDKVKYIKRLLEESRQKREEEEAAETQYKEEFPFTFSDLEKNGIKVGDIVAAKESSRSKYVHYYLLRKGFPKEFNTSLCCCGNSYSNGIKLYQIGFHYVGTPRNRFRKTTEEEREAFINACIETLHEPIKRADNGYALSWDEDHYANILGNMIRDGLITESKGRRLNTELKKIHGVDLLKEYKKKYGF